MSAPEIKGNQRWREGRSSMRPLGEPINTHDYEIAAIAENAAPKAFVEEHHYSGSYPAARERFGLYHKSGRLEGVAVFSVPQSDEVLTNVFPSEPIESLLELGRFVLLDEVRGNGESFFLGECRRQLTRTGYRGVVSFSDPFPTTTAAGEEIFPGHVGTIYQASNATYLGRSARTTRRLLPDGHVFSKRSWSKIRAGERNWRSAAAVLERWGAPPAPEDREARRAWLKVWVDRLTRPVRHPGNHRYVFPLARNVAIPHGPYLPFPKKQRSEVS